MRASKRILSVALTIALIITTIPVTYAQTVTEDSYTILLQESFDGTSKASAYGTFSLNAGSYAVLPDREGKVAKINLTGSNGTAMRFTLNEPISEGTVYIGYDYFGEGKGDANDIFIATPDNESVLGDALGLFFASGALQLYTSLIPGAVKLGGTKSKEKTWHRVESWLDFDLRIAYFYLDGDLIVSTDIGENLMTFAGWGRISRYYTAGNVGVEYIDNLMVAHIKEPTPQTVISGASSCPEYWKASSKIDILTETLGGTFFKENAKLSVSVTNLIKADISGKLSLKVTNETGETIHSETRDMFIEKDENKKEDFLLQLPKFGYYDVKTTFEIPEYTEKGYMTGEAEYTIVRAKESSVQNQMLGYSAHSSWGDGFDEQFRWNEVLAKLGFSIAREAFYWSDVQKELGGAINLSDRHKVMIDAAKENNIRFMIQLAGTQGVHTVNKLPESKEELDNFYNYVYETVKLLKEISPESNYIEFYNEYQNEDPKVATAMQKVGYEAAKAANPDIIVCGGVTARVPAWVEHILQEGYGNYMDVFSFHPYTIEAKPEDVTYRHTTSVQQTKVLREQLDKYGCQDVEIIISELSYAASSACETEVDQASYGLRQFIMMTPLVGEYIWYNAINKKGRAGNLSINEQNFGLLKSWSNEGEAVLYQAKPVALAFGAYNDLLAHGENLGRVETADEDIYIYKFKTRNNEDVIAIWNWLDKIETIGLKLGVDTAELYDMYGNKKDMVADANGVFNIAISGELTYIKGNFDNIELTTSDYKQPFTEYEVCMGESYSMPLNLPFVDGGVVEVVADDNFNITRADFERLDFKVGFDAPKNSEIKVSVKKGNKVLYCFKIVIKYVDPIVYKGAIKAYNTGRYMWEINISNSRKSDMAVSLKINEPESLSEKTFKINKLISGDSRKIKVNIPIEDVNTEKLSISGVICVESKDGIQEVPINISEYTGCLKYTTKNPVIDGKIDVGEWDTYLPIRIKNRDHAKNMEWGGMSDLSAEVYTMIDDEFMYLGAIVKDDVMHDKDTPVRVWNNDSIQFAIATERRTGANNSEFGLGLSNGEVTLQRYTSQSINNGIDEVKFDKQTEYAVKRYESEKKTVYELKMKLSDIYDVVPDVKTLKNVIFAICLNDHDGVSRGWMEYTDGGIASPKDPSLYMYLPVYRN